MLTQKTAGRKAEQEFWVAWGQVAYAKNQHYKRTNWVAILEDLGLTYGNIYKAKKGLGV